GVARLERRPRHAGNGGEGLARADLISSRAKRNRKCQRSRQHISHSGRCLAWWGGPPGPQPSPWPASAIIAEEPPKPDRGPAWALWGRPARRTLSTSGHFCNSDRTASSAA